MAMRLATEYVKTYMQLTEAEMAKFIQLFAEHQASLQVKVLENGSQEVVLEDDANAEIVLSFEKVGQDYVCQGRCTFLNRKLVNAMRQAVSLFKGDAVVHRMYVGYTMIYTYQRGSVVKIVERKGAAEKVIFEYKDTAGQLELLFRKQETEREIATIRSQVNALLDLRNTTREFAVRGQIDLRLSQLSHRLFVLEA